GITGTSAYNDVAAACFAFGVFYTLQLWDESKEGELLALAGFLAGSAFAIKYTAGLAIVYAALFVFRRLPQLGKSWRRPIVILGIAILVPVLPWVTRNIIWLGNPFSPFFNQQFPNPYIHVEFEKGLLSGMQLNPELKSRLELPLMYSIGGAYIGGLFGPWLL